MSTNNFNNNNNGFKIRLRKLPTTSATISMTATVTNTTSSNMDISKNHVSNNNYDNQTISTTTTNVSSCLISDPILTNIASKLNIPESDLLTPKKNFGKQSEKIEIQKFNNHNNHNNNNDNNTSCKFELESAIVSEFQNVSIGNQSDIYNNSYFNTRTYELERFEAKRRLAKQKVELLNKFPNLKFAPKTEDEEDDENREDDVDEPLNVDVDSKNKMIRAFSADDSVVEIAKDEYEPKFVRDINFQILKHPNSQQKINGNMEKESMDFKNKTKCSSSSSKKIKLSKKHSSKLLPLNLDNKLASTVNENQNNDNKNKVVSNQSQSSSILRSNHSKSSDSLINDSVQEKSSKILITKQLTRSTPQLNKIVEGKQSNQDSIKKINKSDSQNLSSKDEPLSTFEKIQKLAQRSGSKHIKGMKQSSTNNKKSQKEQKITNDLKVNKIYVNKKPYQVLNVIGKGGSSKVYQVYCPESLRTMALKKVDLKNADKNILDGFCKEIQVLQKLSTCQRVVKMYDYEFRNNNQELFIVMEKGDADLSNVLKSYFKSNENNRLSPHLIKHYWQEMLEAVREIHEKNIVHSDLKPVNFILVSGKLKLIDFGIANTIQTDQTNVYKDTIIGTVDYMAPESFQKRSEHNHQVRFNQKVDIWSLGIILYNLVYGCTPFSHLGSDVMKKGVAIVNGDIKYDPISDHLLLDVIKKCLQKDPRKRPTAAELLNHIYLKESSTVDANSLKPQCKIESSSSSQNIQKEILSQISSLTPNSLEKACKVLGILAKKD